MLVGVTGGMQGKRGAGCPCPAGAARLLRCIGVPRPTLLGQRGCGRGARRPGLLLEWRRTYGGHRWQGRVVYAAQLRAGEWALVEERVDATLLAPA
jgi:hypothetical protein